MINIIWFFIIMISFVIASINGNLGEISSVIFDSVIYSVELTIKLLGPMALWLGLMNIAKKSSLVNKIARLLKPIIKIIFPEVPDEHPAAGAIVLNLTANIMGLGNSATPLGINAMQELQKLNKDSDKASLAMCTLLALNTSSITLIPAMIISIRAASGSNYPAIIVLSTIFATTISTITALICDRFFRALN
ncbi:nucleoside recognition domain-containing protein [Natronospora cellulosivora (SeqCode)]